MKDFWKDRYSQEEMVYAAPAARNLLLPAEGEGRNAVYAAQKGWQVLRRLKSEN